MYADDSTVYMAESTIDELASVLNKELQLVIKWVTHWFLISLKLKKHCIWFCYKRAI